MINIKYIFNLENWASNTLKHTILRLNAHLNVQSHKFNAATIAQHHQAGVLSIYKIICN